MIMVTCQNTFSLYIVHVVWLPNRFMSHCSVPDGTSEGGFSQRQAEYFIAQQVRFSCYIISIVDEHLHVLIINKGMLTLNTIHVFSVEIHCWKLSIHQVLNVLMWIPVPVFPAWVNRCLLSWVLFHDLQAHLIQHNEVEALSARPLQHRINELLHSNPDLAEAVSTFTRHNHSFILPCWAVK